MLPLDTLHVLKRDGTTFSEVQSPEALELALDKIARAKVQVRQWSSVFFTLCLLHIILSRGHEPQLEAECAGSCTTTKMLAGGCDFVPNPPHLWQRALFHRLALTDACGCLSSGSTSPVRVLACILGMHGSRPTFHQCVVDDATVR
jgi:hypothetical protein